MGDAFTPMQQLRKQIKARRRALSHHERAQAARNALNHLRRQRWFLNAKRLAFYLSANGELDPRPAMQMAHDLGKQCFLPVLHPVKHNRLWFVRWTPETRLDANMFGILEPEVRRGSLIPPWALDVVIMPLVAFDAECHRVGMGGGYYDRTFAYRLLRRVWHKPLLAGYAYEFQRVTTLRPAPWDVPLDRVISPTCCYSLPNGC